jgi:DNA-3-methyladenine glycosylase
VKPVARSALARDPREVAPDLLGKVLVHDTPGGRRSGRIVEVEAYCGPIDAGAHTYRGRTPRNATMFGPAGLLYVYFTYGMHWCVNVVCGDVDEGVAVLVRALQPLEGLEQMRAARGRAARRERDLCSGPAKLAQALGLDGGHDGVDLLADGPVQLLDDGTPPPPQAVQTTRIGLSAGAEHPWRWYVAGDPNVSRP